MHVNLSIDAFPLVAFDLSIGQTSVGLLLAVLDFQLASECLISARSFSYSEVAVYPFVLLLSLATFTLRCLSQSFIIWLGLDWVI